VAFFHPSADKPAAAICTIIGVTQYRKCGTVIRFLRSGVGGDHLGILSVIVTLCLPKI